jgi:hypothetical protein
MVRGCGGHRACAAGAGSAGEVEEDREIVWENGRLNVYFLCENASKIHLDALCDVMRVL